MQAENSNKQSFDEYYQKCLFRGELFQDFAVDALHRLLNLGIYVYESKKFQISKGESVQGFEFKYDSYFHTSKRLWIELQERKYTWNPYVPGGILKENNTWMYCIGDEAIFYVIPVRHLRDYRDKYKPEDRENDRRTSIGYFLPILNAEGMCAVKIVGGEIAVIRKDEVLKNV